MATMMRKAAPKVKNEQANDPFDFSRGGAGDPLAAGDEETQRRRGFHLLSGGDEASLLRHASHSAQPLNLVSRSLWALSAKHATANHFAGEWGYEDPQPTSRQEEIIGIVGDDGTWVTQGCDPSFVFHPYLSISYYFQGAGAFFPQSQPTDPRKRSQKPGRKGVSAIRSSHVPVFFEDYLDGLEHVGDAVAPLILTGRRYGIAIEAAWALPGTEFELILLDDEGKNIAKPNNSTRPMTATVGETSPPTAKRRGGKKKRAPAKKASRTNIVTDEGKPASKESEAESSANDSVGYERSACPLFSVYHWAPEQRAVTLEDNSSWSCFASGENNGGDSMYQCVHVIGFETDPAAVEEEKRTYRRDNPTAAVEQEFEPREVRLVVRATTATAHKRTVFLVSRGVILKEDTTARHVPKSDLFCDGVSSEVIAKKLLDESSRKYWLTDCLTPQDRVSSGFVDPGRSNDLCSSINQYDLLDNVLEREVIRVDECDGGLAMFADRAKILLRRIQDSYARAQALFYLVAAAFGGQLLSEASAEQSLLDIRRAHTSRKFLSPSAEGEPIGVKRRRADVVDETTTVGVCQRDPPALRRPAGGPGGKVPRSRKANPPRVISNTVPLGAVRSGLCRHRSLLLKYLADLCRVPCFLVRGSHGSAQLDTKGEDDDEARHTWNIVVIGQKLYLADTMLQPELMPWPHPEYHLGPQLEPLVSGGLPSVFGASGTGSLVNRPSSALVGTVPLASQGSRDLYRHIEIDAYKISLFEMLGKGATAVVRRASIGSLTCAAKIPLDGENDTRSLWQEYTTLLKLRNIPTVISVIGWRHCIFLEYVPSSLLGIMNQMVLRRISLSVRQIAAILQGLLSALVAIHNANFAHRDVKAENVLVVTKRCSQCIEYGVICENCTLSVKLADFVDAVELPYTVDEVDPRTAGEAVLPGARFPLLPDTVSPISEHNNRIPSAVGTIPYVAPEAEGNRVTSYYACDIWAVGVLAVEMFDMTLPEKGNDVTVGHSVVDPYTGCSSSVFVPRPSPKAPRWLRDLVEKSLQVDWRLRCRAVDLLKHIPSKSTKSGAKE